MTRQFPVFFGVILLFLAEGATGQPLLKKEDGSPVAAAILKPLRTSVPPTIDGSIDDEVWRNAPSVSNFLTFAPDFGKTQEERTEVFMAYDAENLYFAFRCYDQPDKIKTSLAARDNIRPDDWICVNLDTFGDQQGLTALYVNPFGIQMDSRFATGNEDFSVDLVWYSAGQLRSDGYVVELQLPLKSLRYSDSEPVTMTVFFERYISRRNEHGSFPPMDPKKGFAFLTQMTPMEYSNLEHYTLLEMLPAVVFNQQYSQSAGALRVNSVKREGSLTMKYGLTSDLILDGTINPDFSQVESDAGQVDVNLRTNLFFDERRPFFLEGREIYGIAGAESGAPFQSLFHTRTIVDPVIGLKLSGKVSDNQTISTLIANDELGGSSGASSRAWFGFGRYKLALTEDSYVGAALADREIGSGHNRVGGADGRLRVGAGSQVLFHVFGSIDRQDKSPTLLRGHATALRYESSDRDLFYGASIRDVSSDFHADMGFLNRTGVTSYSATFQPYFFPDSKFFNRIGIGINSTQTRDHQSGLWETSNILTGQALFAGNLNFVAQGYYSTEVFLAKRFKTSGLYVRGGGQFLRWISLILTYTEGAAIYYDVSPFQGYARRAQAALVYQPSDQARLEYTFTFSDFHRTSDQERLYEYPINRLKAAYQFNKYVFFRAIGEYNGFRKRLLTDFLASFTYIPGTVLHAGYGSLYYRQEWEPGTATYVQSNHLLETNRGLFLKASYLWRL